MHKIQLLLFAIILSFGLEAQSPYQLNWKKEAVMLSIGGTSLGFGKYLRDKNPLFTTDELITLDRKDVNAFDRLATHNNSQTADDISDYLWLGAHGTSALLLLGKEPRSDLGKIFVMYSETYLLNGGLTTLAKSTFKRPRPYVFNENFDDDPKLSRSARASFISGHTSMTAANTFFAAKLFSDYYPDSKWKPYVWTVAATVPAITGFCRVAAGKHYPTDVIAGYAVGATIGFLVPHLHRNKNEQLTIVPGLQGMLLVYEF